MAAQLSDTYRQRLDQAQESIHADCLRYGVTTAGLAVERAIVADARVRPSERDTERTSGVTQDRAQWFIAMDMLVGIQVSWIGTYKAAEQVELVGHLRRLVDRIDHIDRYPCFVTVRPFAEIDMQAQAELQMFARIGGCLAAGRPANHQAGAGNNALLVGGGDPPVDRMTLAEVIGGDNQAAR